MARSGTRPTQHKSRQQVQILSAVLEGQIAHALGLAFEHLDEFAEDQLVAHTLSVEVAQQQDGVLSTELDALFEQVHKKPWQRRA
jgi:hypothetical protein